MVTVSVLNAWPEPGGAKTTMLFATLRLVTVDGPVTVHVVPLFKLTFVVEVGSDRIAPVRVEAFALSVMALKFVASRRLLLPALAVVPLKFTVPIEGSAKIRSPDTLLMLKLSNVAV